MKEGRFGVDDTLRYGLMKVLETSTGAREATGHGHGHGHNVC
jgi:hypothetical protein